MAAEPAALGAVIVTGGASGLGRAVAEAVAQAGGTPIVLDRRPAEHERFEHVEVDLAAPRFSEDAVRLLAERHGDLRGVVTAAGIDACGPLSEVDPEAWDRVVRVNLIGTAAVVRAALPALERNRGRIVTVASTLGYRALPDATAYCASKFGVVGFSRALQVELAGRVGVTLLIPGGMATRFFDGRPEQYRPGPDAQLADPGDVARAVVFALGQPAGFELREIVATPSTEPSWP